MHALGQFRLFAWGVAVTVVIIGALLVFVTMMGAISERTREIGVHKALGATPWNIVSTILLETLFLTFISGYFGLVAGVFLLEAVTKMLEASGGDGMFAQAEIDFATATIALGTLMVAGTLAAILPATKAARIDPIDSHN